MPAAPPVLGRLRLRAKLDVARMVMFALDFAPSYALLARTDYVGDFPSKQKTGK
jgi:hypothetical protein